MSDVDESSMLLAFVSLSGKPPWEMLVERSEAEEREFDEMWIGPRLEGGSFWRGKSVGLLDGVVYGEVRFPLRRDSFVGHPET